MREYTKTIQLLLLPSDEQLIAERIVLAYPSVVFIDGIFWEAPDRPPLRSRVSECTQRHVQIWNRELFPELPTGTRDEGRIVVGPTTGPVIQWLRSELKDGLLTTGRLAVSGFKEEPLALTWCDLLPVTTAQTHISRRLVQALERYSIDGHDVLQISSSVIGVEEFRGRSSKPR